MREDLKRRWRELADRIKQHDAEFADSKRETELDLGKPIMFGEMTETLFKNLHRMLNAGPNSLKRSGQSDQ
jgi:hypothetical protein